MNTKQLIGAVALALAAGAAAAGPNGAQTSDTVETGLSRSEVIADLHLAQRAGLDKFGYDGVNYNSPEFRHAWAIYLGLRNGPAFEEEVRRVAAERHEDVGRSVAAKAAAY
jgi:hypothetical protein